MEKQHYNIAVAVILDSGNKVLCVQHGQTDYSYVSHKWGFPYCKTVEGEKEDETLKRELSRKLNTNIFVQQLLMAVVYEYPDFIVTMNCYICLYVQLEGKLTVNQNHEWLDYTKPTTLDWTAADSFVIKHINNNLQRIILETFPGDDDEDDDDYDFDEDEDDFDNFDDDLDDDFDLDDEFLDDDVCDGDNVGVGEKRESWDYGIVSERHFGKDRFGYYQDEEEMYSDDERYDNEDRR